MSHRALSGGQFGDFTPPATHADSWFPNETDEEGTFLDHTEALRSVLASKPLKPSRGRELN